jgi:AcrR family transcriptional regulator
MPADPESTHIRLPRVRSRGHQRRAILRLAADLASIDGLEQVTLGRLATAMQMSKSGLYAYFTSKEDLQLATIESAWEIFDEHVLDGDHPIDVLLRRWIAYYEQEIFPGGCPFATAALEFANRDCAVHDALAEALGRQLTVLREAVERAQRDGRRLDVDAEQLAFELYAVLTAGNQRFRMTRDPDAFAQTRTATARLLQPLQGGRA